MEFNETIEAIGKLVDLAGVTVILVGIAVSTARFATRFSHGQGAEAYRSYRMVLGRSILLGLEMLVAADIIRTVAATPTFRTVGVLGLIVLIRTFLSVSLEVELTHRFPWQGRDGSTASPP